MSALPVTAEEIDAAWLTDALTERHANVRVAHVEVRIFADAFLERAEAAIENLGVRAALRRFCAL